LRALQADVTVLILFCFGGNKRRKKYKEKNGTLRAQDARPFASSLVEAQFISFQFREGKKMRPREKKTMTIL
jgi:hypothetical protein